MTFTHLPLRRAFPAGVVAYLIGYGISVAAAGSVSNAVMAVIVPGEFVEEASLGAIFGSTPSQPIIGGWLFYNAHFIPTSLPTADAVNGIGGLTNRSLLLAVDGTSLVLFFVPFILLLSAGFVTVRTGPTPGVRGDLYGGASVAVGYLPLLIVGAFLLTASARNTPTVASPDGLQTIFIGLVYPLLVGALGGKLAARLE